MLAQLVIIQVITFLAIVFVLRKLLYSESAKEIIRLRNLKDETSLKQKELQEKIDQAEDAFRQKMAEADERIRELKARHEAEAEEMKRRAVDDAKAEADRIIRSALNAKEKIREEISVEMRKKAPLLASRVFKEALSPVIREAVHRELIRDVVDKIKKTEKAVFNFKTDKGEILTAYPLTKPGREEIELIIRSSLGYAIPIKESQDETLVAGVIIKLGTVVIDASLDNRLRQIEKGLG